MQGATLDLGIVGQLQGRLLDGKDPDEIFGSHFAPDVQIALRKKMYKLTETDLVEWPSLKTFG